MRFPKRSRPPALFLGVAVTLMVFIKLFVVGDYQYVKKLPHVSHSKTELKQAYFEGPEGDVDMIYSVPLPYTPAPEMAMSEPNVAYLDKVAREKEVRAMAPKSPEAAVVPRAKPKLPDTAEVAAVAADRPKFSYSNTGKPKIVIIIDDLGMNRTQSLASLALPGPLTMAFLPYAPRLAEITGDAKARGHELIVHTPMEPMKTNMDPGPMGLMNHMSAAELQTNLDQIFKSFDGYVGINNHMGSRLTQNADAMAVVMKALKKRGMFFVDSKTIASSVAIPTAIAHGVAFAERDVFLDHENTPEFVQEALAKLERVARRKGVGIAIGHPKAVTVAALREWLPSLKAKGFELVPVSAVLHRPQVKAAAVSGSQSDAFMGELTSERLLQSPETLQRIEPATY